MVSNSFMIPWTVAHQAPLSMELSRQEYWSGQPFPSPGDLPDPEIEPRSPAFQVDSLPSELLGLLALSTIFSLVVNTCLGGDAMRLSKFCFSSSFHPPILAFIRVSCLQQLLLWSVPFIAMMFSISLCPSTFIHWNFILWKSSLFSPNQLSNKLAWTRVIYFIQEL